MRFSVLIATRGRPRALERTLESLSRCDPPPDEIVVADGDEQRSAQEVTVELSGHGRLPAVRYLAAPPGLTRQRNHAIARATGDVLVFIDDDVVVDRRLFAVLASAYRDRVVVGATGRVLEQGARRFGNTRSSVRRALFGRGREGTMTRFGYPRRIQGVHEERDVEFMQGCLMSGRREAVEQVGFDECLTGYALCEDEDFSYRLSRLGRLRYLPAAIVNHENTGFRTSAARDFNRQLMINRAYLFRKNFERTPLNRLQFAGLLPVLVAHRAVNGDWQGVRGLLEGAREAWRSRR